MQKMHKKAPIHRTYSAKNISNSVSLMNDSIASIIHFAPLGYVTEAW